MFNIRVRVQFACWSWADSVNADSGTTAALAEAVVRFIAAENSLCLIFAAAAAAEFIRWWIMLQAKRLTMLIYVVPAVRVTSISQNDF